MVADAKFAPDARVTTARPARARRRRRDRTAWLSVVSVVGLLALWWAAAELQVVEPLFLPHPRKVLEKLVSVAQRGYVDATLLQHVAASLGRVFAALLLAVATAVPLGIALGRSAVVRRLVDPLIEFYRPIPPLAYLPLIVIWWGIGETTKILLIYLAIFAPVAIATAGGVRSVPPDRLRAARALGATRWQLIGLVVLPSALPEILVGIRIGLGVGWSTLVASELVAARSGLGFMIQSAAQFLATDIVVMGILVIAVIAFALELAARRLQRWLAPWQGQV